ncbi:outer membrane protein assembly factor BamD [Candidatus Dependentiae bacterium]|nr:outer membrane protein assembly factor BamD [Candidatus Dependentiae bacterium]
MLRNTLPFLISALIIATPVTVWGVRHSKTKKKEPLEKYIAKKDHTLDLSAILSKQTKDLTFEQAQIAREHYNKEKNDDMIAKCGQRLLAVGGDQELMRIARLELADIFLRKGNYKEAEKYALEYQKYYPGAVEAKKAAYIAIRANFLSKLPSDRDQEKTRTTITLAKEFLTAYQDDTEYTPLINTMLDACYKSLVRSELHVIEIQLNSYYYSKNEPSLAAAEKRLAFIQETFLPHTPTAAKKIASLEAEIKKIRKTPVNSISTADDAPKKEESALQERVATPDDNLSEKEGYLASVKDYFFEDNDSFFAN